MDEQNCTQCTGYARKPFSRRSFLKIGGLVTMTGMMAPAFLAKTVDAALAQGTSVANGAKALVVVQLGGGNDGLNTVIPFSQDAYYKLRPTLGIPASQALRLNDSLALHPAMKGMKALYDAGHMAVVTGVGYPNPNYSHFRAMEIWQSALPDKVVDSGWIGRYLAEMYDVENAAKDPARAAELRKLVLNIGGGGQGGGGPLALWTEKTVTLSIDGINSFQLSTDPAFALDRQAQLETIRKVYSLTASGQAPMSDFVRNVATEALAAADGVQADVGAYKTTVAYPPTKFGQRLKMIAALLSSDFGARVFFVPADGGYDTHHQQARTQEQNLTMLSEGLSAFYADLQAHSMVDSVTTMTFSEFGRRAQENGSKGTDHGAAQPQFIIGGKIKGGIYGQQPSLTDLDNGNLKFSTDFRSVYGTVVKDWLGVDPKPIVEGDFPTLPFISA